MSPKFRYAVVFIVGVLVGLAVGAWGLRAFWRHSPPTPERIMARMDQKLHFTDDQKTKVLVILREETVRMKTQWKDSACKFDALREDGANRIRAVLDPAQQATFDAMKRDFEKRRRQGCPPPPDGSAPPPPGAGDDKAPPQ